MTWLSQKESAAGRRFLQEDKDRFSAQDDLKTALLENRFDSAPDAARELRGSIPAH